MEFHVDGDNCYMTDGKIASHLFGFRQPTEVVLTYHDQDTTITLKMESNVTVKNETEQTIMPFDTNTYTLHSYDNDQMFGWEQMVSQALASERKNQVLVSSIINTIYLLYTVVLLFMVILC
jgi:hypothetical protein